MEIIEKNTSVLFYDTEGKGNKEALMDYCLAYTAKMCDRRYHRGKVNTNLQQACLKILAKLIEVETLSGNIDIRTYFQYEKMDLIIEVYFEGGDYAAILIEDKVDNKLSLHQVTDYRKKFDAYYNADNKCIDKKYWVIKAADHGTEEWEEMCQQNGFKITTLDKLISGYHHDTGNEIFDEFWLRDWE